MLLSIQSEFKKWRSECTCSRMTCDSCSDAKIFSWAIILRITWKVGFDLLLFSVFRERLYSPGFYCFQKLDAVASVLPSHFHSHFDWQVQINVFDLVSDPRVVALSVEKRRETWKLNENKVKEGEFWFAWTRGTRAHFARLFFRRRSTGPRNRENQSTEIRALVIDGCDQ